MHKLIYSVAIVSLVFVSFSSASAAKPQSSCVTIQGGGLTDVAGNLISLGYDQWGYNYEAHMFNGWYDNYTRPQSPVSGGDRLMMKWSDSWLSNQSCDSDSKLDRPANYRGSGAWLTNHASGKYTSATQYHWDVGGTWVIAVNNGAYPHDYTFTMTSLPDGTFTGTGGYPAGALSYVFDEVVVNGQITGDAITFTASYYQGGLPTGYAWNATGTIGGSGTLSGTGDAGVFEWHSTSGAAAKVYNACYYQDFVKIIAVPNDATKADSPVCSASWLDGGMWYASGGAEIGCSIWGDFALTQEVSTDSCGEFDLMNYRSQVRSGLGNW